VTTLRPRLHRLHWKPPSTHYLCPQTALGLPAAHVRVTPGVSRGGIRRTRTTRRDRVRLGPRGVAASALSESAPSGTMAGPLNARRAGLRFQGPLLLGWPDWRAAPTVRVRAGVQVFYGGSESPAATQTRILRRFGGGGGARDGRAGRGGSAPLGAATRIGDIERGAETPGLGRIASESMTRIRVCGGGSSPSGHVLSPGCARFRLTVAPVLVLVALVAAMFQKAGSFESCTDTWPEVCNSLLHEVLQSKIFYLIFLVRRTDLCAAYRCTRTGVRIEGCQHHRCTLVHHEMLIGHWCVACNLLQ
jgi:hypothetical protein